MATAAAAAVESSKKASQKPRPKKLRLLLLKIVGFLGNRLLSLCWVTYVLGLVWVLLHPAVTVSTGELKPRGTYISENALLIDSFDARSSHDEVQIARDLHRSMLQIPEMPSTGCGDDCAQVVEWIYDQLRGIDRVEFYRHAFTDQSLQSRTNVYGILRASPLADGKESIVLVAHYRNAGAANGEYSGVSVGLTLLKYLVGAKWLAKDIILLFADGKKHLVDCVCLLSSLWSLQLIDALCALFADGPLDGSDGFAPGTEAWLQGYHLDPLQLDQQSGLPMRAGVIRAAVNIETLVDSTKTNAMGIFTAGINGQLPNLDLVNTAVRSLRDEHIPVALDRCDGEHSQHYCRADTLSRVHLWLKGALETHVPAEYRQWVRDYLKNLNGMLRFMTTLASGPSGAHAHFIGYNIDSITLSTMQSPGAGTTTLSLRAVLRSVEKIVRAMSNLEEKLHQSFFLYVLPNTKDFVSVGEYYYVVALAVSPAIAHLARLASKTVGMRLASSLVAFLFAEGAAVFALASITRAFSDARGSDDSSASWSGLLLAITLMQASFVCVFLPLLRSSSVLSGCAERRAWRVRMHTYEMEHDPSSSPETSKESEADALAEIPVQDSGWRGIKFIVMALIVYSHCIIGIINYPMALFCAIPMALFSLVEPLSVTRSVLKKAWCAFWLFLSSPIAIFVVGCWLDRNGFVAGLRYIVDSFALRVNLLALPYLCCLYLPVHTLSLGIWLYPAVQAPSSAAAKAKKDN